MDRNSLRPGAAYKEVASGDVHVVTSIGFHVVDRNEVVIHTPRGTTRVLVTPVDRFMKDYQ